MAKRAENIILDAIGDSLALNIDQMSLCSAEPTTHTEADTTFMLAKVAMAGGDFTNADGDTNGRKVTVAQKASIAVTNTGTGNHVALMDDAGTTLYLVTTCPGVSVDSSGTVTINTWDIETADPV